MIEYKFYEVLYETDLNILSSDGWVMVQSGEVKDGYAKWVVLEKGGSRSDLKTNAYIQNSETGTNFYLRQEISYGDFLVILFLTIFLVLGITGFLLKFFIPRFINFKKH